MLAKVVVVLTVCVAAALSHPATKVCATNQWQGAMLGKIGQVVKGTTQILTSSAMTYTDYTKKMESFVQKLSMDGKVVANITTLIDFNKMKTYEIYPSQKRCVARDLPSDMPAFSRPCIGDERLKRIGSLDIGGKMAGVFEMMFHNQTTKMTIMMKSFTPVSTIIQQTLEGFPQMLAYQFGNVTDKIDDASVFDVPSYCMKDENVKAKRVCSPHQWEADAIGEVGQKVGDQVMKMSMHLKQARDYKNKLEASDTRIMYAGNEIRTLYITHWAEGKAYRIDANSKKCTVLPLHSPQMVEMCSDSKMLHHIASLEIDGKMADMYEVNELSPNMTSTMTMFRDTMTLVSVVNNQVTSNVPQMIALQYGNITTGINDPSVFILPDYCNHDDKTVIG